MGSHRAQGPRSYQEDRTVVRLAEAAEEPHAYFAVFDGHGGAEAADYAVEHLHPNLMRSAFADVGDALRDAYLRTDAGVLAAAAAIPKKKASNAGAAAVTMLAHARRLVLAHAGDCRALLVKRSGMFVELTRDHSAEDDPAAPVPTPLRPDEVARIARAGARVESGYVHVDDESLPMTRALGDLRLKVAAGLDWRATSTERQVVTALPDVATYERSDDDLCVVLASDGLFGSVMTSAEVAQRCWEALREHGECHDAENKAARALVECALKGHNGGDNVSVIVVTLDRPPPPPAPPPLPAPPPFLQELSNTSQTTEPCDSPDRHALQSLLRQPFGVAWPADAAAPPPAPGSNEPYVPRRPRQLEPSP